MQTAALEVVQTLPVDFLQIVNPHLHSSLSSHYAHGVRHRVVCMRGRVTALDEVAGECHVRTPGKVMGLDGYRVESNLRVLERRLICSLLAHDIKRVGKVTWLTVSCYRS